MQFDPDKHKRHSIRLNGYDYSRQNAYFLTICAYDRESIFGDVVEGKMDLNRYGQAVLDCWLEIPEHSKGVELDAFVVMPDHIHGIILMGPVGARHAVPSEEQFGKPISGSFPTVVRSFKSGSAKCINSLRDTPGFPVWQRNYYERVIRDEAEYGRILEYIELNPPNWKGLGQAHALSAFP